MNNVADIGMNFYEKSKFENNSIYKFINVGDWIFSDMKWTENLHGLFYDSAAVANDDDDDDDDDDELKTCNPFTINKTLHNDSNNPLNHEEYDYQDDIINAEYYSSINRVKLNILHKN